MAPSTDNAEMSLLQAFIPSMVPTTSSSSELQDTKERFLENRCFFDESSVVSPISTRTTHSRSSKKKKANEEERKNTRIADDRLMDTLTDLEPKHQHHQYTWEELSKYFGVSLKEAATMLKIHPTQLKRIYSTLGIEKWPYKGVKEVTEIRKREQISEIYSMEEMKFGNTVIEEAIEFGLRNTAKRVPVSVKLAEFKGAKCRQKVVIPPMTAMIEPGLCNSFYIHDDISTMPSLFSEILTMNMRRDRPEKILLDDEAEFHDILIDLKNSPIEANDWCDNK